MESTSSTETLESEIKIEPVFIIKQEDEDIIESSCAKIEQQPSPEDSVCLCVVCSLLKKGFDTLDLKDQIELVRQGRPTPPLNNLSIKIKTCTRRFNVETYDQYEWLTGCETQSKLFCWSCLIFGNEKRLFNRGGFYDLNNLHKILKKHYSHRTHLKSVILEKLFIRSHIIPPDDKSKITHQLHNEIVERNKAAMKRLIDIICFFGLRDIGLEGQKFKNMVLFLSKYDEFLRNHLNQPDFFPITSDYGQLQNNLVCAIEKVVMDKIKLEVEEAPFVAIILHESTDRTGESQISLLLRYLRTEGPMQERFLQFVDLHEPLHEIICNLIKNVGAEAKVIAQRYTGCYFNAGQSRKIQRKVRESFPNVLVVHCLNEPLFPILSQSLTNIAQCKCFFAVITGIGSFLSNSTTHLQALDVIIKRTKNTFLEPHWNLSGRLILTVRELRQQLIELFENILDDCTEWDDETLRNAGSYLVCLQEDLSFNFLLSVFSEIFPSTDDLFIDLQNDATHSIAKKIEILKTFLEHEKCSMDRFWGNANKLIDEDMEPQKKRVRTDLKDSYSKLLFNIIDHLYEELSYIFENFNTNFKFLELWTFNKVKPMPFPEKAYQSLMDHYGQHFSYRFVPLHTQLTVVYDSEEITSKSNPMELWNFFKEMGLENGYYEVVKLCKLLLTIPVGVPENDGSTVRQRIKTFVENSTIAERQSKLPILFVENDLLKELSENPHFHDDVTAEFAEYEKRIALDYRENKSNAKKQLQHIAVLK